MGLAGFYTKPNLDKPEPISFFQQITQIPQIFNLFNLRNL
ncbi:MAG: hypothetical protein DHS20C20_18780 [Ardenticatenaceae bacterium]|nr:MAG: hypothetical protein DHS20C20_18780 [Ardenticatenaceae bacterium]